MEATAILVSVGAFMSALFGGIVAARATRSVGAIIAVGAGIRIGAAFFDLIPESVELLGSLDRAMVCTAIGFLAFYAVEKMTTLHVGHETATEMDHAAPNHRHVGIIGATGMSIHSFLDGVALAAGLQVGGGLGLVIAAVVIVHRFSDGIGIVSFMLASHTPMRETYRWVGIVAVAPVLGVLLGLLIPVPDEVLGSMLGVFAGFFLYIGAAELLPEAHRSDRSRWVALWTFAGVVAIYLFSIWAGVVGVIGVIRADRLPATRDRLRAAGQRVTPQRLLVAEALATAGRQLTAQELWQRVRRRSPRIGRATVFRTVEALVGAGVARRLELPNHASGYIACQPEHHHHLACSRCGRVEEIGESYVAAVAQRVASDTGFVIDDARLDFYGRCASCANEDVAAS